MSAVTHRCPNCGFGIDFGDKKEVECPACGNLVVFEENEEKDNGRSPYFGGGFGGSVAIDGIQTANSAYAYFEQLMQDYDFDSFTQTSHTTIPEVDRIVEKIQTISADNPVAWLLSFDAIALPVLKRLELYSTNLDSVVDEYKKNVKQAYTLFENRSLALKNLVSKKDYILTKLNKYLGLAEKYHLDGGLLTRMKNNLKDIEKQFSNLVIYDSLDEVDAIVKLKEQINNQIAEKLLEEGLVAEELYQDALKHIEGNQPSKSYPLLVKLGDYKDSSLLVRKHMFGYSIKHMYEICSSKFVLKGTNLYKIENKKLSKEPTIKNIRYVICSYFEYFVYITVSGKLSIFNTTSNEKELFELPDKKKITNLFDFFSVNEHALGLLFSQEDASRGKEIYVFDYGNKNLIKVESNVLSFESCYDDVIIYKKGTAVVSAQSIDPQTKQPIQLTSAQQYQRRIIEKCNGKTYVYNCRTEQTLLACDKGSYVPYADQDNIVVVSVEPNAYNFNIYVKNVNDFENPILIEKNAYKFLKVIDNHIFYSVGNSHFNALFRNTFDGKERFALPRNLKDVLYSEGEFYFSLSGYSSMTLTKSSMDGSKNVVIANYVKSFECEKNGYFYYINVNDSLCKARYDGKYTSLICNDVSNSLGILKDGSAVYTTVDSRKSDIKSLYLFTQNQKQQKLAYDVKAAEMLDDNTVDYVVVEDFLVNGVATPLEVYHRKDLTTNEDTVLFIDKLPAPSKKPSPVGFIVFFALAHMFLFVCVGCISSGAYDAGFALLAPFFLFIILGFVFLAKFKKARKNLLK